MVGWIRRCRSTGLCVGALTVALALAFAGCSGGSSSSPRPTPAPPPPTPVPTPTPSPTPTPTPVNSISGAVHGGLGPIAGSQVTLYAAGQNAYHAGATALGSAITDSSGKFKIGFTPPATPELLYLVAIGGNAGAGSNGAIGLMGVIGESTIPETPVMINELTTVAGEWALAQFIDSTGQQAGAPLSNSTGMSNAAQQVLRNLADTRTGKPASFLPTALDCSSGLPPTNCDALKRLDTLANVIAACAQSSGPDATLPSCAVATGGCDILFACTGTPASGTTLEAAHAIAANPADNVGKLFAAAGAGPYQPALGASPDAFEIALNFAPRDAQLDYPIGIEADLSGNIWIANLDRNSITELSPTGRWLGTFAPHGASFDAPFGVAIDQENHIWVSNSNASSVTELDSKGLLVANRSPAGAQILSPLGIEIDGAGNVWIANYAGSSMSELLESTAYLTGINYAPAKAALDGPVGIAIDTGANIWVANYGGNSVSELTAGSGYSDGLNFDPDGAKFSTPLWPGLDSANNVWISNFAGDNISELIAGSYNTGASLSPAGAGLNDPAVLKIDSAGNLWTVNSGNSTLSEVLTGCSSGSCTGLNFDPPGANLNSPYGVTADAAGNVWVADSGNNSIAEFIGLAAPTGVSARCLSEGQPSSCLP